MTAALPAWTPPAIEKSTSCPGASGAPCLAGATVGPAGDIDADGVEDILVGVPGWRIGYPEVLPDPGGTAVVFGKNIR